jgi:hypothetical protein
MSLPVILPYGVISIYQIYGQVGNTGIIAQQPFNFGAIDQISPYGIQHAVVGQTVLFNGEQSLCRLAYANKNYTLLNESSILSTETVAP